MFSSKSATHPREIDSNFKINLQPSLTDCTVLVTGAGTGIGRGTALEFARQGANVALHYFNEDEGVTSAEKLITDAGGKAIAIQADLRKEEDITSVVHRTLETFGKIDVLVNNAGITANIPFLEMSQEQFNTILDVNLGLLVFEWVERAYKSNIRPDLSVF